MYARLAYKGQNSLAAARRLIFITTNQTNYNLATATAGQGAAWWHITISPGVVIKSTSPGTAAFTIGALPSQSFWYVLNQGTIEGKGGLGGTGGGNLGSGTAGAAGGKAFDTAMNGTIVNDGGDIWGGGGGGGGAAGGGGSGCGAGCGGGGGGGAGRDGGAGGPPGSVSCGGTGTSGATGTASAGGAGGTGKDPGTGGTGGGPGVVGNAGQDNSCGQGTGGAGGAAGKAIEDNGATVTLEGDTGFPNIRGAIT